MQSKVDVELDSVLVNWQQRQVQGQDTDVTLNLDHTASNPPSLENPKPRTKKSL